MVSLYFKRYYVPLEFLTETYRAPVEGELETLATVSPVFMVIMQKQELRHLIVQKLSLGTTTFLHYA